MDKFRMMILYYLKEYPRVLCKTELLKLIYLFDCYCKQLYNEVYTGTNYIRYNFGPYVVSYDNDLGLLEHEGLIASNMKQNLIGKPTYYYSISESTNIDIKIDQKYKLLVDDIIYRTELLGCQDIVQLSYKTPPMLYLLDKEEQKGSEEVGMELDMSLNNFKKVSFTDEELASARKRRLSKPERGSVEERYQNVLDTSDDFFELRRRACLCKERQNIKI